MTDMDFGKQLLICLFLLGLLIGVMLLVGQRDFGLKSWNNRLTALEDRSYTAIPRIEVSGKTNIYAVDGEIVLEEK